MTSPLVPAHVDLRDFPYMPLDVVRLRDSKLVSHTTGEGFRCAVLLWCVAWHQVPAGSLPDDDLQLAQYAGFGRVVKEWKKLKAQALHGWVQCDDGRWYHETVAEKALEAWNERLKQRYRTECARIKKAAQRAQSDAVYPSFEEWVVSQDKNDVSLGTDDGCPPDVTGEKASKGREGKGREGNSNPPSDVHPPAAPAALVGVFEGHPEPRDTPNPVAKYAIALSRAGFQVTSLNPELIAYAEAGGTVEHLQQVAGLAECAGKKAGYVLAIARRELTERAKPITGEANGTRAQGRDGLVDGAKKRADRILEGLQE